MHETRPRGLLWRVSAWLLLSVLVETALFALAFFIFELGNRWLFWLPMICGVLISIALARLFGLHRRGTSVASRIGLVAGALLSPFAGFALLIWIYIEATIGAPPPLAADLPANFDQASVEWTARLTRDFPPGTDERRLVSVLMAQGFRVDPHARYAEYNWSSGEILCGDWLTVFWKAGADGHLQAIDGSRDVRCP